MVQRVLIFIVMLPLLTSVVVRTFAWIVILAREGVINQTSAGARPRSAPLRLLQTELGLVIALTQIEMPLMLLPLLTVMSRIDPNPGRCLAALGASKWRTLFQVIAPADLPGLDRRLRPGLRLLDHRLHLAVGDRRQRASSICRR